MSISSISAVSWASARAACWASCHCWRPTRATSEACDGKRDLRQDLAGPPSRAGASGGRRTPLAARRHPDAARAPAPARLFRRAAASGGAARPASRASLIVRASCGSFTARCLWP